MKSGDDERRLFPDDREKKRERVFKSGDVVMVQKRDGSMGEATLASPHLVDDGEGRQVSGFMAIGRDFNRNVSIKELKEWNP